MSRAIDVLAVLDYEIQIIPLSTEDFGPQREQDVRDLREARAAVAELIEAADGYAEAEAALANWELVGINADPHERLQRRVHSAREQLDAALARVRGAA